MKNEKKDNMNLERSKRIGVLMGGCSYEREVSLKTGKAVASALKTKCWQVSEIDVDEHVWEKIRDERIDVAFLALHGRFGEDGTIQGMLEIMGIPYTGSGVLASSLAMDKIFTKIILQSAGILTPPFIVLKNSDELKGDSPLGYPVVVKPASQGSTIGIHIVKKKSDLKKAISDAFKYDRKVMIEEFIPGRELTVGILGTKVFPVLEIIPQSGFYDFKSKYTHGMTKYVCPAPLEQDLSRNIQRLGLAAHSALGCRDFSRVDFRINEDGIPFCLEINTIPGMTDTSLLPKAAEVDGLSFPDLVERILFMALSRHGSEASQNNKLVNRAPFSN
ncbi:MAG: D-alanine--D-alanine ligase [bacterium]